MTDFSANDAWPVDYVVEFTRRSNILMALRAKPALWQGVKEYYKTRPVEFLCDWGMTYDPRNAGTHLPTKMPFLLFKRQRDFMQFLLDLLQSEENGLVEKCRDMGATWLCVGFSVWMWLFQPGSAVGWGSRKEQLVDKIGDPDSIFEKIRMFIRLLPPELLPKGFKEADHMAYMRIINPENDATITGEAGDNIGRGGRKRMYFKDEAQPMDSKLLTPNGWSTMGEAYVGMEVIGIDGKPTRVVSINECGEAPVYKLTFKDGTEVKCSENHLWEVDRRWTKKISKTLRTKELVQTDDLGKTGASKFRWRIPTCKAVEFNKRHLPLHPYVVGLLLGDGSINGRRLSFTTADPELVDNLKLYMPDFLRIKHDGKYGYYLGDELGFSGGKPSRIRLLIMEAGIYGRRSWEKLVPDSYKFSSVEDRIAVLQGLMDTDGSATNGGKGGGSASFHTSSEQLANDVVFLCQSLGGTSTLNVKKDKRGFRDKYVLHLNLPNEICPFRLERKVSQYKSRTLNNGRRIKSIEYIGIEPVRCITVSNKDGLYLTDGCVVTHNSAHYERPEKIEAALADNTRVQVDISSVNGPGNVFHRRRQAGALWKGDGAIPGRTNVFIMDWRDHPGKSQAWYNARRQKAVDDGMLHIFAQEVERNYAAAVENVVIPLEWVMAAIDAHKKIPGFGDDGMWVAGLDVADEGLDKNALVKRKGLVIRGAREWGERDTGVTTRNTAAECQMHGYIDVQYDCIGIGAGIKAEVNRLVGEGDMPKTVSFTPWNAAAGVLHPDKPVIEKDKNSPLNKDFYGNLKAQAWWMARRKFEKTFRALHEPGFTYKIDDLVSISSDDIPRDILDKLTSELSQPTFGQGSKMKMIVNKTPEGTKSPNLGDAAVMCLWPVNVKKPLIFSDEIMARAAGQRAA